MEAPFDEVYTHGHDPVVVAAHSRRTAEEAAAFLLGRLTPGMRVLDVGCGPGTITVGLARRVAPGAVVGVDASARVLDVARHNAASAGLSNIEFEEADAYDLPAGSSSVDVVYAHQLLQHLADPVAALREMARVLRPGGIVAVRDADYGTMTHYPHDPLLDRWLDVYHQIARGNGGEPDAGRRLLEWVGEAGFTDPVVTSSTRTYATEEERREWAGLWAGRLVVPSFVSRAEALGVTDAAELASIGAVFRRWMDEPAGWFAFINGEVLAGAPR